MESNVPARRRRGHGESFRLWPEDELLQRMASRRDQAVLPARGKHHLTDIKVPARVRPDIVGSEEIADGFRVGATAPADQQFAVAIEEAQPRANGIRWRRLPGEEPGAETDFHHKNCSPLIDEYLHRPR